MTLALCALTVKAQEKLPLKLIATIPMPGFTGDFDHFALDLNGNRLFLASEDQKTVEVFDLRTGERIHSIKGFGQPLTMAYLAESNRLIVTDGGDTDAVELVESLSSIERDSSGQPPTRLSTAHTTENRLFHLDIQTTMKVPADVNEP
jgi:WD40 repeat protein